MIKTNQIRKGDIVEINFYNGEDSTIIKQSRAVLNMSPDRLAIIRIIDENTALVALCKLEPRKTTNTFKTNVGEIYIHTKCFYAVDSHLINPCGEYLLNSYDAVSKIYDLHNQWVEDSKKRREAEKALKRRKQEEIRRKNALKKELRHREKEKKSELEISYSKAYEIAIMNNDKETMSQIEKIVGHPPCQSSKGYASPSRKGKASNKSFNPKPLSGGRFSPK